MSERIKCQKDTKIFYNYLRGFKKNDEDPEFNYDEEWPENEGPLNNIKLSTLFALAFSIGYKHCLRDEISNYKDLSNPINFEDFLMPMIDSIAIFDADDDIDIIKRDKKEVYNAAEEYANGGINKLMELYIEDMDTIINEWHMDIDELIEEKDIFNKIRSL